MDLTAATPAARTLGTGLAAMDCYYHALRILINLYVLKTQTLLSGNSQAICIAFLRSLISFAS